MHKAVIALLTFVAMISPAFAWDIDKMNEQIEKTNVIVGGVCSGTLIGKKDRLVLTAYHCINDLFENYTEEVVSPDGTVSEVKKQRKLPLEVWTNKVRDYQIVSTVKYGAKIVGQDAKNDIALLQITDEDFVPPMVVHLAPDSYKYKRGLKVYAVGNPGIKFDNSISEGIIAAPERSIDFGTGTGEFKMFQHSATTIGGNSGGSILNDAGELIGTVTGGLRGAAISFAIPVRFTKDMIRKSGFAASVDGVELPVKLDTSKVYPYGGSQ
jgi:S1-C subfamily serine protease